MPREGRRWQRIRRQRHAHERARLAERGIQQEIRGRGALLSHGQWQGPDAGVRDAQYPERDLADGGLHPLYKHELARISQKGGAHPESRALPSTMLPAHWSAAGARRANRTTKLSPHLLNTEAGFRRIVRNPSERRGPDAQDYRK